MKVNWSESSSNDDCDVDAEVHDDDSDSRTIEVGKSIEPQSGKQESRVSGNFRFSFAANANGSALGIGVPPLQKPQVSISPTVRLATDDSNTDEAIIDTEADYSNLLKAKTKIEKQVNGTP